MVNKTSRIAFLLILFGAYLTEAKSNYIFVSRVIDGDTLQLSSGEKVRLIGIDTPEASNNPKTRRDAERTEQDIQEIIAMGKRASAFTRQHVEGRPVRLEFDIQEKDRYGRLLAYVFLPTNIPKETIEDVPELVDGETHKEIFLNALIVKAGYAQVYTVPPNVKHQDLFLRLQKEARERKRGLWNE